jgi:hypothetical protein
LVVAAGKLLVSKNTYVKKWNDCQASNTVVYGQDILANLALHSLQLFEIIEFSRTDAETQRKMGNLLRLGGFARDILWSIMLYTIALALPCEPISD